MKHYITSTVATITLALALASSPASAFEYDRYPGTACRPYDGSQVGDFITGVSSLLNHSSSGRWVSCPIVGDNQVKWGSVDVSHKAPSGNTENMSCYVINTNMFNSGYSVNGACSRSSGSNTIFHITNPYNETTHYQNLRCNLPPHAQLNWYGVSPFVY